MKISTPFFKELYSHLFKKIILSFGLITCLTTVTRSQASLNPSFPASTTICTGLNATFSVAATATGTITYQWQESIDGGLTWNNLIENTTTGLNPATGIYTGTTGPVLTITRTPSTMTGNKYQSIVSVNGINSVTSGIATLNVGPDVSLDNVTSMNCPATSATLNTAGAVGVNYQWQVSSNAGSSWSNIIDGADASGVTYTGGATSILTISPLTTSIDGYLYRYVANDGAGCVITSGITTQKVPTLAVFTLPAAGSITASVGSSVSIPATITAGTGPFTYQWQVASGAGAFNVISNSNTAYSGATTSTLTILSVTTTTYTNRYRVTVKNAGGCATASSSFAQVNTNVTLPLKLETFTAQKQGSAAVKLLWTVDGQYAAQSYTVQGSADGYTFTDRGLVKGEAGKTAYSYLDDGPGIGISLYRIKITDQDGSAVYSAIVKVINDDVANRIELRPSITAEGFTSLYTALAQSEAVVLTVTDVTGRLQWSQSIKLEKGENYTLLNVSRLSKGIYYIHVTGNDGISKAMPFVKN
ncbi:MAG TPA: T9SS type A sorting domain-containing protein [Puia sp.]|nr:T9SS type A sorting domain-containing protein [Puia sp.]